MTRDSLPRIEPTSRSRWRHWLVEHHQTARGIWLILHKKRAGPQPVTLDDAVREALCFGWIDSTLRPLDATRSVLLFTPRRAGSTWSRSNRQRVAELTAQGLMTDAGLSVVEAAKRDGSWDATDAVDALRMPADLAQALAADATAHANFDAFTSSAKKQYLWWIQSAKRPETRATRIDRTVRLAAMNRALTERNRERP